MRSAARPSSRQAACSPKRLDTVDFWRGFVLCTIFVNHVPGNVFERFTYRNFGLSDSAEAFVFISGLALALGYGRRFAAAPRPAMLSLGRRAVKLYAVHVAMSLVGVAVFAAGAAYFLDDGIMTMHGRDLVVQDPLAALVGLVSLGHQFGYFNILPLYIVLVAFAPVLFWLSRLGRPVMLGVSLAIYAAARLSGLNIPTWPMQGDWFLDPFAWQLMMAIGIACGLELATGSAAPGWSPSRPLLALSALVVVAGAVCATDALGVWPGLFDVVRASGDLNKTVLGLGRLVHFLCLAYLVGGLGLASRMRGAPWFRPLCLIGRHGLPVFVLLSLLAAFGQVLEHALGHTPGLDILIVGSGLALLYGFALLLQHEADAPRSASLGLGPLRSIGRTTL